MGEHERLRRLLRAAHALGAAGLLALAAAMAFSLPARAQGDAMMVDARDSATVAVERNADGLATCLYTGPPAPLDPVADAVCALAIVDFGAQIFVQGRAPAAQVVAYSMAAEAMAEFPEPLSYGTIFTTILDRRATQ